MLLLFFFSIFCNINYVTTVRNMMLSMEMRSSLEAVLCQSCLMHITLHTCLLMGIMKKPSSKNQMSLISLQEVCTCSESFPSPRPTFLTACLCHPAQTFCPLMACSPGPQPKFSMMEWSRHSDHKGQSVYQVVRSTSISICTGDPIIHQ